MSYAQGTEHYEFPQFVGSDRPTFVDFNAAFRTIDTKLYGLEGDASTVDGRLDTIEAALPIMDAATQSAQNTADSAKAEADTNAEHITALEVLTGQHTTQIGNKLDSVAIAEQYDPSAGTYNVGAIVVYNGQRYRCTTAVAVAEPFDADKWTGEDVQTVLDSIRSDFSDHVITVTADGVKTSAVLIAELMNILHNINLNGKRLSIIGAILPQSTTGRVGVKAESVTTFGVAPTSAQFSAIQPGTNVVRITSFETSTTSANVKGYLANLSDTTGIADIASIVPNTGMVLELHYRLLG